MNPIRKMLKQGMFLACCIGIISFSSCKKNIQEYPEFVEIIPSDALFVVSFNNEELVRKGNLSDLNSYAFLEKMKDFIQSSEPAIRDFFDTFIQNSSSSGLDLKKMYYFGIERNKDLYMLASFKMEKQSVFENNLLTLLKSDLPPEIELKDSYKLIKKDDAAFVWNDNLLLAVYGNDINNFDFDALFTEKNQSIVNEDGFQEFYQKQQDIGAWLKYGKLVKSMSRNLAPDFAPFYSWFGLFENIEFQASVNFENGEIKSTVSILPKSEVDKLMKKYPFVKKDFDNKLLGDFPEETYLLAKFAVDIKAYIKFITDMLAESEEYGKVAQEMLNVPEVKSMIDAFGGDFLLSLHGFAQGFVPFPLVSIGFTVNGQKGFDNILSLLPQELAEKTGDFYTLRIPGMEMFGIYFAYKDNRVLVTDDADVMSAFTGKSLDKTLKDNLISKEYINSPNLFYLNLNYDSYPQNIKLMLNSGMLGNGKDAEVLLSLLNTFKGLSAWQVDNYNSAASLSFKDNSKNSLAILLTLIDNFVKSRGE